ncbi:diguanylate cyclase response regulator [Malaciobacter molluscorum LMG 25693]|uniref:diguanylate cyclase n=1 Tax=Malaciobacter molluscorum LMG 25693 TaxID=870501 RepID=A0A2G1DKW2_9BACT|nr:diguanylate cyclase [Malaciobacter molluscorum]AXX92693.1 two-component system response regulator/diguanylate cyclase [Malaciobacter molluscorum LMG 25693]PHO19111.1 diguanylate cyclase response regulator [Malaciobacter molluscorum LMG 25693]RXJ97425.1 diguanylate cyclase response regulator [Malaciobacter molluscorum]
MNKKILVIDDNSLNIEILVDLLGDEYDVFGALDAAMSFEIIEENLPDLILLDIVMPDINGFELCQKLKLDKKTKNIPIIFITAKTDEDSIEKAFEVGGIDYVTKPFKPKELLVRVKTQLKIKDLISNLEYISSYDTMTNTLNRRKFFEEGEQLFTTSKNLYAIMIDIDNFKMINDQYGHHIGDVVIKQTALNIMNKKLKNSFLGRIGGEEFALIGTYKNKADIIQNIDEIRIFIQNDTIFTDNNEKINFTISSGISFFKDEFITIDDFLKDADKGLYEAKGSGKNKTVLRQN